jgi:hypothetical protein
MDLTTDHFSRDVVTSADLAWLASQEGGGHDVPYGVGERVGPKFASVAAMILWQWSLDSGQDEDCGDAQYGNGWHALFRDERAFLHTDSQGFVTAWRAGDWEDIDALWKHIEAGAVYPDDFDEDEEG